MKTSDFGFDGIKLLERDVYRDSRGYFMECFNALEFAKAGLPVQFKLDARSHSKPGIVRGLHFQYDPAQGKIVEVTRGRIWDVVVDLRMGSPTLGKYAAIELSGDEGKMLWVPFGFAHGFCVLGNEPADVLYRLDAPYGPEGEGGIKWSDKDISIKWPIRNLLASEKDNALTGFADFKVLFGKFFK